jgi:signal transduction histidine kinase
VADGWLLTQGKLMAERSDNPLLIKGMERLRRRSLAIRQAAELSSALLSSTGLLPSEPQASFWLPWGSNYWLIAIDRSGADSGASRSNAANSGVFSVRAFPADTLGRVVIQALTGPAAGGAVSFSEAPRMPDGLKAEVALSGHPLRTGGTPWLAHDLERNTPLLAEFELPVGPPLKGQLAVRIHLVDKSAIYAQQRQREWLMGAMILLTAGVAGVGARQAHRAYQRQWALNEQKSNFVSSVSHELRAPLASMRLLAEGLLNGRVHEDAKRQEYAGFLLQETRRLGSLVENVLDFARIEQGRKQYDFEPTDVVRLVAETIRLMEPLATEQQVSITGPSRVVTSPERESVVGNWDGAAVQRALLNLLDNALKHAPLGSRIEVSIVPDLKVRAVSLRVKDQGPGIPASEHERIFERFYRRGSELRRETKGVGLGLTIVRHIMEAHGGQVRVSSEVGQGAEFILELPLSAKEVNE